ncbi:hypothetical protein OSB04_015085 [Centaurea solstitialis]|uniref:PPM-type phosphatase domain-containing protein n=1 Tax=Centaurea solstitialis TaxID=347529 RepID=A0AA38SYB3_9ASTR|nr:hypothetical protein OSB04_015085 [Centaurea solstitialis]
MEEVLFVLDNRLVSFAKSARFLEILHLEECNRIRQRGILGTLSNRNLKLKSFSIVKCTGIKDQEHEVVDFSNCRCLRSLTIKSICTRVQKRNLVMVGKLCPHLHNLDLSGLCGITDSGLFELLTTCTPGLVNVNLSDCVKLIDKVVVDLVKIHGGSLEVLNLDGCRKIDDESLSAIAENCFLLNDLECVTFFKGFGVFLEVFQRFFKKQKPHFEVAEFCSSYLHEKVFEFWEAQYSMDTSIGTMEAILTKAFQYVDDLVAGTFDENVGSTAVVVLVMHTHLITANYGDSREVLSRGSEAIPLSVDHNPDVSEERSRIKSLGGLVLDYPCPRVYGILLMSRAIGTCIAGTYMNLMCFGLYTPSVPRLLTGLDLRNFPIFIFIFHSLSIAIPISSPATATPTAATAVVPFLSSQPGTALTMCSTCNRTGHHKPKGASKTPRPALVATTFTVAATTLPPLLPPPPHRCHHRYRHHRHPQRRHRNPVVAIVATTIVATEATANIAVSDATVVSVEATATTAVATAAIAVVYEATAPPSSSSRPPLSPSRLPPPPPWPPPPPPPPRPPPPPTTDAND